MKRGRDKNGLSRAEEVAQKLSAFVALADNSGSFLSTHMVAQTHVTPVSGDLMLTCRGTKHAHGARTDRQTEQSDT